MTSFAHVEYPRSHPGVTRFENAVAAVRDLRTSFSVPRSLSAMLLAAMVAALVVVADQLIDTWADGHLMAAWVSLWVVAFAALGLLAGTARSWASSTLNAWANWSRNHAQRRADARLWDSALRDPRVMADLQAAMTRHRD